MRRGRFGPVVALSWWAAGGSPSVEGVLGGRIDVGLLCPERGGRIDEVLPGGWMLRLLKEGGLMNEACPDFARSAGGFDRCGPDGLECVGIATRPNREFRSVLLSATVVGDLAPSGGAAPRLGLATSSEALAECPAVLGRTSVPLPAPVASRLTPETVA